MFLLTWLSIDPRDRQPRTDFRRARVLGLDAKPRRLRTLEVWR